MPVAQYLNERGFNKFEGYCEEIRGQVADLKILVSNPAIKSIMEIGFNAGHSAELFLSTNPKSVLTSFDLGVHDYGKHAKDYIDLTYPLRHALELGDSTVVVPEYIKKNLDFSSITTCPNTFVDEDLKLLKSYQPAEHSHSEDRLNQFMYEINNRAAIPQCKFCPEKYTLKKNFSSFKKIPIFPA